MASDTTPSALLRTLANSRRLTILSSLARGELSVGDLIKRTGLNQSALSQHLARLRVQSLVATRRQAQMIYYRIADHEALAIAHALLGLATRRQAGVGQK